MVVSSTRITSVAPSSRATASRCGLRSATTTSVAPKATAHCMATRPTGPAPVTRTLLPAVVPARRLAQTHRERLEQSRGVVRHGVRDGVGEGGMDHDELGEGAVDRWGRVEPHGRAEVVSPRQTLLTGEVGDTGLNRDAFADTFRGDFIADGDDHARRLVPEHHRRLHDEVPDPPVLVVVDVRSADADGRDADKDLTGARPGYGTFLDRQVVDAT